MPHKTANTFTRAEVSKNTSDDSLWFIIDSKVYDVSDFIDAHPGGEYVLKQVAGTDATEAFYNLHKQEVLQKYSSLCIGTIEGEKSQGKAYFHIIITARSLQGPEQLEALKLLSLMRALQCHYHF